MRGAADERSEVIHGILKYIKNKLPTCFFLENVVTITTKFKEVFEWVLTELISITDGTGEPAYEVRWKIIDSRYQGAPQSRRRVYIVGLRRDSIVSNFIWPPPLPVVPLRNCLDTDDTVEGRNRFPKATQKTARRNVREVYEKLEAQGIDPRRHDIMIDTDSSRPSYSIDHAPTVTSTRGSNCGWWLSRMNRRIKIQELFRIQGFRDRDINFEAVTARELGLIVGNAFTQTFVRRLLARMLPAVGLTPPLDDGFP